MSVTSTYGEWVTIEGGPEAAAEHLGAQVIRIAGRVAERTVTRWPGGVTHTPGAFPPDPIPEVWLTYPDLGPAVRLATLSRRSDLYQEDPEILAATVGTFLAHDGMVNDWPETTNFRTLPRKLRQDPFIIGCFEFPATTVWAGPNLALRLRQETNVVLALCAPPEVMDTVALTTR